MRDNFERCLAEVLKHEGGWSDHSDDPGGATNKGVTLSTYRAWKGKATKSDLRKISDADVAAIYRAWYWQAVRGDDLPAGLDLVAFDAAVNSGPSRGARWLQQALGVSDDGKVGPQTVAAAKRAYAPAAVMRAIAIRRGFLKSLKTWPTFGKGWTARLDAVEAAALAMAEVQPPRPDVEPVPEIGTPEPRRVSANPGMIAAIVTVIAALAAYLGIGK